MKQTAYILLGAIGVWLLLRQCARPSVELREVVRADTVVVRDTIREPIPVPVVREIVRHDTIRVPVGDTLPGDSVAVSLPIERKTYRTDDYRAVVEGYRPSLVEMEIYRQSTTIATTTDRVITDKKRWGIGIQAGYGYNLGTNKPGPYIGLGLQYSLWRW
ncbi:MAG: porin family protein [Rikenella sp.]|nr:porin family protein [Rikenella sp.]